MRSAECREESDCWCIRVADSRKTLASRVGVARSMRERMVGLLGRRSLAEGEGLILLACRSIHTYFMRFAIDAVFVDAQWRVVAIAGSLPPWRLTGWVRRAAAVIELSAGTAERVQLKPGDHLKLLPIHLQKA